MRTKFSPVQRTALIPNEAGPHLRALQSWLALVTAALISCGQLKRTGHQDKYCSFSSEKGPGQQKIQHE